jgi:hypothetical protein
VSEEHDLVEVPENAIRDEPLAFGLTAPQLGLAGAAAAVAFVLNLLPIWLPVRLTLAILVAAPIFGVAVISIRGEPGYRWLLRFVRYARSERRWFVPTPATADPATPAAVNNDYTAAPFVLEPASDSDPAALPPERRTMGRDRQWLTDGTQNGTQSALTLPTRRPIVRVGDRLRARNAYPGRDGRLHVLGASRRELPRPPPRHRAPAPVPFRALGDIAPYQPA